ncbi:MAG: zinc-binding dehydrogenase [Pseudomonadales bacterium]|nr:zinc-binding dehydrogenase [Pseudomonadales bacterium]
MKAVVCQDTELRVADLPEPEPGRGQVLVQVLHCGICGSDLHVREHCGHMKQLMARVGFDAQFPGAGDPVVFGHEFCCEVLEHGPGCERKIRPGTRVVAQPLLRVGEEIDMLGLSVRSPGAYAERMLLQESALVPVPNGLTSELAALTEPMAVACHAVRRSEIAGKDVAIVVGCGPVGLAVICLLKARGAKTIVASDFSPGRRALAQQCGADVVIDPAVTSPWSNWQEYGFMGGFGDLLELALGTRERLAKLPLPWWHLWRLAEALGQSPARPVIFECVGVPGLLSQVIDGAPMLSRVVVAGVCMQADRIEPAVAIHKEIDLRFVFGHSPIEFRDTLHMIAGGKVDCAPLITGVVGLDGVGGAFTALKDPEQHAKILIDPASTATQPVARGPGRVHTA